MKKIIKPCSNKICKACGLYLHQQPVSEKAETSHVFWVGLSAVQFEEGVEPLPLSPLTNSGALISSIETPLRQEMQFYKTNLVKCAPLQKENGKIRYPFEHEMEKCFPNLEYEMEVLTPTVVFLLGKQTASFVMKKMGFSQVALPDDFKYKPVLVDGIYFVSIHHPSYMLVYKRSLLNKYTKNIQAICKKLISKHRLASAC